MMEFVICKSRYIYIYTYMYIHVYTCIYMYIHVYMYMTMYACIYGVRDMLIAEFVRYLMCIYNKDIASHVSSTSPTTCPLRGQVEINVYEETNY